jgi:hypothetical protein
VRIINKVLALGELPRAIDEKKSMIKNSLPLLFLCVAIAGCNIGNAPEPMSEAELKKAVENAKPEDQIAWIQRSPMPTAEKEAKIAEIKEKHGIK